MTVDPRPQADGTVLCECGRDMRPMVGWRISVTEGDRAWRLWWECLTGDHVSCAIPIPTEGVPTERVPTEGSATVRVVMNDGSARVLHSPLAQPPEGSLHR